jgi:2-isopropylmalate synthase
MIRYTPEDTVRSPWNNVEQAAVAAVEAGADVISIADTTGFLIPGTENNMYDFVTRLRESFKKKKLNPKIAVHCHNDRGLALANALDGFRAGADIIDTTVLGLGERAGLVDLATLMVVLKNDFNVNNSWKAEKLVDLYQLVSHYSKIPIPVNFPITGANAFTHCAGVHTQAAAIDPVHYESLNPEVVGREREIALSHMSGLSSIQYELNRIGEKDLDENLMTMILNQVKSVGKKGQTIDQKELKHIVEWCKEHKAD